MGAPMLLDDEVVGVLIGVAHRGRPVRRARRDAADDVRRAGGDRGAQRRAWSGARGARRELARKVDAARGAARGRRGGQLEPGPRRGARRRSSSTPSSCPAPTAARSWSTTSERRLFRVRSAYGTSAGGPRAAATVPDRTRRDARRPGAPLERTPLRCADLAAVDLDPHLQILHDDGWRSLRRGAAAARRPDRRGARRPAADARATSPRRPATCSRRSPASRRSPSSTPGCSASSRSRAPSSRSPAGTSRSSWPACRTSCGRRSTR